MNTPELPTPSLADKINTLIQEHWRDAPSLPGNKAMARMICEATGLRISTGYLYMLRTGTARNPTATGVLPLAKFFGVPVAHFFNEDTSENVAPLSTAFRSQGVQMIALRSEGLSEKSQKAILEMIERARIAEKLDVTDDDTMG